MRTFSALVATISLILLAAIAPTPAAAAEQAVTNTSVGTHNSLRGAASFPAIAGIIGWQEVESPAAQQKLRDRLPDYAHWTPTRDGTQARNAIPISWRRDGYTLVSSGSVRTHLGEAKVTPSRWVNHVVLKHRLTNQKIAVVNTHFISGAFSGYPERQDRWNTHARIMREEVAKLRQRDLPVVLVGDFNRRAELGIPGMTRLKVPGQGEVPLDQVYVSALVSEREPLEKLGAFGSDHSAYRATIRY